MDGREMSPDSSTHISEKNRKSKKRRHKQKFKTSHKKRKSSSSESVRIQKKSRKHKKRVSKSPRQSDESEEEIFDIKPLSGYVDDRKQLHKEIFSLVSKKEVKDMLPDTLKKLKFKEFKNLCLEQLEIMSQKRLRHVIAGQEMLSSSSDESTGAQDSLCETKETTTTKDNEEENAPPEQTVLRSASFENENKVEKSLKPVQRTPSRKISILEEMSVSPNQDEIDELIEGEPKLSHKSLEDEPEQSSSDSKDNPPLTLPEAELKELEFRARALKSLVMARERQQLEAKKQQELLNKN